MKHSSDPISQLVSHYRKVHDVVVLLESQKKDHPSSNRSYIATAPEFWIKAEGGQVLIYNGTEEVRVNDNAWVVLSDFMKEHNDWLFGYLGYDLKNLTEDLRSENPSLLQIPDMFFFVPGILLEVDAEGKVNEIKGNLDPEIKQLKVDDHLKVILRKRIDRDIYLEKIKEVQNEIAEGDYYEMNLSHALEFEFEGDPFYLYQKMKAKGPVPFASYIETPNFSVCSSSPERFLSRKGSHVFSQPIKGTVSRYSDNEDEAIDALRSEKNKAENLMIVDLVRNDLSRIAKKGSVKVKDLFEVQSFETVHQMVSTVYCEVDNEQNSVDVIKACFPMGSMTGAPKIAAMNAIERLETYKRGVYSGAIGYIAPDGDFDFNVVIRTAIIQGNSLVYPVGGAITSDSVPEEEWEETLIKAKALLNSLD